ncbi:PKD domain-containing protein [Halorussus pelagicus]|uniref:PKD domain-containing protein n=1 Tax=Halorussus pelagicus TaxID=2505977 RepID=UPI000FFBE962|nr:PKD domain-containing protein [Halorussus pelagicus]
MTERARSVLLALLIVASSLSMGVGTVASTPTGNETTFHVTQGGQCYEISTVTSDEDTVEEFYDYRAGAGTKYGSYGEGAQAIQDNQVSHLFVYEGAEGLSLVMLHDDLNESDGGAISFDLSGLPESREWVVEDDSYENPDDNFDHGATSSSIDWMWASNRTDGAAVRGLGDSFDAITVESAFGENSWAYQDRDPQWPYAENETDWKLRSGDGTEYDLTKGQQLTIEKGSCDDDSGPSAALSASPQTAQIGESVSFDASESTKGGSAIAEYRWDFDGDGEAETNTSSPETNHTYDAADSYDASVTVVNEAGNADSATATVTVEKAGSTPGGNVTYLNATAVEVEGTYRAVDLTLGYYTESGYGQSRYVEENVSGTTVVHIEEDYGINGTVINLVGLHEDEFPGEADSQKENPRLDYYAETIKPHPVTVVVDSVTEVENGTYEVTFVADNPNEETLSLSNSTFSGNVSGEAPEEFPSGEQSVTVTWTPDSDDERAVWTLNRSKFGQSDATARTATAGELSGSDDSPPTARLSAPETGTMSQLFYPLDASGSSDDDEIVTYRWDVDGDGEVEWSDDEITSFKPYNHSMDPGTHQSTVTVVDSAGQTDSETVSYTIEKVTPNATVEASNETVAVGENVTFTASKPTQAFEDLDHFGWTVGETDGPDRTTEWTTAFEEEGEQTVSLVMRTRVGVENVVNETITVKADDGGDGGDDGDDSKEGGFDDSPNRGNTGGGLPPASPDGNDDEHDDSKAIAPLNDGDGKVGSIAVRAASASANPEINVTDTAPENVTAPSADADGFAALSYLNVSGGERVLFNVSTDRLGEASASADAVGLFRHDDGEWSAVETAHVEKTNDSHRFRANVSEGTFAVGIGKAVTSVTDLSVGSESVKSGESVEVTATVENTGHADATRKVELTVGGEAVTAETVSVAADETAEVTFTHALARSGVTELGVGDASAEVMVEQATTDESNGVETTTPGNSSGVPGFGIGVALVALVAAALVALRRQ